MPKGDLEKVQKEWIIKLEAENNYLKTISAESKFLLEQLTTRHEALRESNFKMKMNFSK